MARTAWTRASGLDPRSFWFDDVYVASLTRLDSLATAVSVPAPAPPGFVGALWISGRLVSDPEIALQLIPFLSALLTIPLLAYLVVTVTGNHALGILSAGILALNANSAHYSIFVKPYVTDQLSTLVLLLVAVWVFRKRESSRLVAAALLGVVVVLWSFPSVFLSAALITVATLGTVRRSGSVVMIGWSALWTAVGFGLLLGIEYLFVLSPRANAAHKNAWLDGFVPLESFASFWDFLASSGWSALQGALPLMLRPATPLVAVGLIWLVAVGLIWLLTRREHRSLAVCLLLFFVAIVVGSALHLYPISGGRPGAPELSRTDLFSYPATILLFTLGIHAFTEKLPAGRWLNYALCTVVLWFAIATPLAVAYYPLNHSAFPKFLSARAAPDDVVILSINASYLAGFYSSWPIRTEPDDNGAGFHVHLDRPRSLTLSSGTQGQDELEAFLATGRYEKVFYFTTREQGRIPEPLMTTLNRHGYQERERYTSNIRTALFVFQRSMAR